ncbi:MAG: hypothetical protein KGI37_06665 [Alphaproteobacteria bacterium]|nr:hypothetical protein [Alphaproteobacteria bacterium]
MPVRIVTTVLTAASSYDLTTLANIKDDLAIPTTDTSSDTTLARFITEQSALVAEYCNRVFPIETIKDVIYPDRDPYPYQVTGVLSELQLSRWPLVAVTSVTDTVAVGMTNTLVAGTDFVIDAAHGWLTKIDPNTGYVTDWSPDQYTAQYTAGYFTPGTTNPPADLEMAVLRLVTARFKARGRDPFLRSQGEPGVGQEQYWIGALPGQTGPFPPDIAAVLEKYRVPLAT